MNRSQLEVLPGGSHLIANAGGVVVVVAHRAHTAVTAESPAAVTLTALLGLVREAADNEQQRSGRMLARLATNWLMGLDNEQDVEFGVLTPGDTGVALFLHGGVTAVLEGTDRSEVLRGRDAGFTVDRVVLPAPEIGVGIFVDEVGASAEVLPRRGIYTLGDGTVPGAGAVLWLGAPAEAAGGESAAMKVVLRKADAQTPAGGPEVPSAESPVPQSAPVGSAPASPDMKKRAADRGTSAAGPGNNPAPLGDRPVREPSVGVGTPLAGSPVGGEQPSVDPRTGEESPSVGTEMPSAEGRSGGRQSSVERRPSGEPPLGRDRVSGDPPSVGSGSGDDAPTIGIGRPSAGGRPGAERPAEQRRAAGGGAVVKGFKCSRQHLNDPRVSFCAVCGIRMDQLTCVLTDGIRPPLGLLLTDDGTSLVLDIDIVLGREPEHAEAVQRGARPIRLADSSGGMSRAHAEIRLVDWDVTVVDQGSANGTYIRPPGHTEWIRAIPKHPVTLAAGSQILLGGRVLTFDSQHSQF